MAKIIRMTTLMGAYFVPDTVVRASWRVFHFILITDVWRLLSLVNKCVCGGPEWLELARSHTTSTWENQAAKQWSDVKGDFPPTVLGYFCELTTFLYFWIGNQNNFLTRIPIMNPWQEREGWDRERREEAWWFWSPTFGALGIQSN